MHGMAISSKKEVGIPMSFKVEVTLPSIQNMYGSAILLLAQCVVIYKYLIIIAISSKMETAIPFSFWYGGGCHPPLEVGIPTSFKLEVAIPVSLAYAGGCQPPLDVGIPIPFKVEVAIPFSSGYVGGCHPPCLSLYVYIYFSIYVCIYIYIYIYVYIHKVRHVEDGTHLHILKRLGWPPPVSRMWGCPPPV